MNAETNTELPQESIRLLEAINAMQNKRPVSIEIEDMPKIQAIVEEIRQAEESSKETFEQIETLKAEILERREKIAELYHAIDPRLRWLKENQPVPQVTKPVSEGNGITKEKVLEVLQSGAKGNAEIAKALGLVGDKADQNRIYGLCKQLEGKVISVDRKWQIVT